MTLIINKSKLLLVFAIIIQSNLIFAQLTLLDNGNYLIFPNWKIGDEKLLKSETIETKIINNDITSVVTNTVNIIKVRDKNNNSFFLALTDLNKNKGEKLVNEEQLEGVNRTNQLSNTIQYLLQSTIQTLMNNNTINYKVDKWGYYKGLLDKLELGKFHQIVKNEISQWKEFKRIDSTEIFNLIDSIQTDEIQELVSQSFYGEIQPMHLPYDLELIKDSTKIDTLQFLIPWFKKPVSCVQSVTMTYNKQEIKIQIMYNYLIDEDDLKNSTSHKSIDEFSLNLNINYILDYSSKWIKSIFSKSFRKENNEINIELSKVKIKNAM